jgi:hypothetical protein
MLKKKASNIVLDSAQQTWKKRPSEIRGYQRTFYITAENGDYIRVDYNLKDKRVRLYVEVEEEGGNAYYSVITDGKISAERSVSTGRNFGFSERFNERAMIFSTLPNNQVLKLISRNYGIQRGKTVEKEKPKTEKQKLIQETKKRYFKPEFYQGGEDDESTRRVIFKTLGLFDIIDFMIGLLIAGSVFLYFGYSYLAMGVAAAFFGIIIGFVDMFFRGRSPVFFKVVFFLLAGVVLYIYGYFM